MQFLANADKETISKAGVYAAMYSGEVFSAYEMMVGQWVNKNESSVSYSSQVFPLCCDCPKPRIVVIVAIDHPAETRHCPGYWIYVGDHAARPL